MMRVLIVDDEPLIKRVLTLCLERAGYAVECACDGADALERVRAQSPDFMITDVNMPGMGGEELCRAIHAEFPGRSFPILVVTATTSRASCAWALDIPNTDLLEKPISPRNLIARLRRTAAAA